MVCSCSAFNCRQKQTTGSGISFHSFPKDPDLRDKWILATKRVNFEPSATTKLCSLHFTQADFVFNFGRKRLRKDSVPSIFEFSKDVTKGAFCSRKRIMSEEDRTVDTASSTSDDDQDESMETTQEAAEDIILIVSDSDLKEPPEQFKRTQRRNYFGDFKIEEFESPEMQEIWTTATKIVEKHNRTIKYLRNKSYKLTKKIKILEEVLRKLQ